MCPTYSLGTRLEGSIQLHLGIGSTWDFRGPWMQGDLQALGTGLSLQLQRGACQLVGKAKGLWEDGRLPG